MSINRLGNTCPRVGDCGQRDVWPLTHAPDPLLLSRNQKQLHLCLPLQGYTALTQTHKLVSKFTKLPSDDNLGRKTSTSTNKQSILFLNMTFSTFVV